MRPIILFGALVMGIAFSLSAKEPAEVPTKVPAEDNVKTLSDLLRDPNASLFAKTAACKQAARTGTEADVAALASFLQDETLSHPARIALQQIPSEAASAALCDALREAKGKILIGLIGSLGERRDPKTVSKIVPYLDSDDAVVVRAAVAALGKIGGDDVNTTLLERFNVSDTPKKALLADGLFACAERRLKNGRPEEAVAIYNDVRRQKELPVVVLRGALRGEILARGKKAGPILEAEMTDPEEWKFQAALEASRDLNAPELTPVFLRILPKLEAVRKVLLLDLLDARGDAAAKDAVLQLAKTEGEPTVRCAAIRALAGHPGNDVVAFLLDLTTAGVPGDPVVAGIDALCRMRLDGLETGIVERLSGTKGKACIPLVEVCSRRKMAEATPILLPLLNDPEYDVRLAVLKALGNTVSGGTIDVLIEKLVRPASKIEFDTVRGSIGVVCRRTVDQDAVAGKLAAVYDTAPTETKVALLDFYGALGGTMAIQAVEKAAADPNEAIQDAATRVLGNWPTPDAAPLLLGILKNPAFEKFHVRALRGYIRIVRQMDTSNEHRFAMCMQAFELARRDEEKLLLIDALGRIPTSKSLDRLAQLLDHPTFAEPASLSALLVGGSLLTQQREKVADVMQKIVSISKNDDTKRRAAEILEKTKVRTD